jgi:hypothetical protein
MIIPIGPKGSGKSLLFRQIALIADPRDRIEAFVQRLPRDEKDRRVNIYNNFVSYFDNESALDNYEMDELCTWVTGYSGTVLHYAIFGMLHSDFYQSRRNCRYIQSMIYSLERL